MGRDYRQGLPLSSELNRVTKMSQPYHRSGDEIDQVVI